MENKELIFPEEGKVIMIDKELDWTSFNVVKKIKGILRNIYKLKKIKVGHAGTLDPLASGLVIVCAGKQTKNIEQYQAAEKEYITSIKIGATTPSFDLETEIDKTFEFEHVQRKDIEKVLEGFIGEQDQIPPIFSAKNINGKRAYEYARKGQEVVMKPSRITISELELLEFESAVIKIRVVCSKGTYIRAFARDIGERLNSGAHMIALRRTRIGNYYVEDSLKVDEFEKIMRNL